MDQLDIKHWLEVLEVGLIASVKFLLAPFEAERYHFSFWESFTVTTIGGIIGVFAFYYAGTKIAAWWQHLVALVKSIFSKKPVAQLEKKHSKKFTRSRRFIIKVKRNFGLVGVAFVTPCIISIPIGTMIAGNFYKKRKGVLFYFIGSVLLWSLILNGLAQYLALSQYIPTTH
ncbi:MAG: hypothetical protein M3R17_16250 [Bacteroidota bacterium]|nr:hypothetical protein [Bacteroidota bacterium]